MTWRESWPVWYATLVGLWLLGAVPGLVVYAVLHDHPAWWAALPVAAVGLWWTARWIFRQF